MFRESHDTYLSEQEDIQNTVDWDAEQFLKDKSNSIVKASQELKELQINIFKNITLKLWLVNLLYDGKILEDQFNDMLEEYDCKIRELLNRREVVLHANNEDFVSLNTELNKSTIFLAEIEKRKEIGHISEEEYLVKKRKFQWEINHYQNDISVKTEVLSFLENPYNVISRKKYNDMKQEAQRCRESIDNLNTSDNINFNTIKKIKISMEELVEHLRGYNLTQQKQLDSLDFDEANVEIRQPTSPAVPDEHYAREETLEQELNTEEIIDENKSLRVECPYTDVYGEKCKVIAFSKKKADAYQKLKGHVIKKHPEKIKEFTDMIKKLS